MAKIYVIEKQSNLNDETQNIERKTLHIGAYTTFEMAKKAFQIYAIYMLNKTYSWQYGFDELVSWEDVENLIDEYEGSNEFEINFFDHNQNWKLGINCDGPTHGFETELKIITYELNKMPEPESI